MAVKGTLLFGLPVVFDETADGKVYLITPKFAALALCKIPEHIRRAELAKAAKKCGIIINASD